MKRRKFMKGLIAVLGMAAIPLSLLKSQGMKKKKMWALKLKSPEPRPDVVSIEIQTHKSGYSQTIHIKDVKDRREIVRNNNPSDLSVHGDLALAFFTCPGEIKIDTNFTKDEIHTVVISYKYKDSGWMYIYISATNFHKKNNYTFSIKLLDEDSPFDTVYWMPNNISFICKRMGPVDGEWVLRMGEKT